EPGIHRRRQGRLPARAPRLPRLQEAPGLFRIRRRAAAGRERRVHHHPRLGQQQRSEEFHPRGGGILDTQRARPHRARAGRERSQAAARCERSSRAHPLLMTDPLSNPRTIAFLFPGQGSQAVGMGKELAERYPVAKKTFEEADGALGYAISTLCFEGPEEKLKMTEVTHPAILTVSVAA